jgi:hypothetical protein
MRTAVLLMISAAACAAQQYMPDGRMMFPADYREWIYLSSGLGMTYDKSMNMGEPSFDNVFVNRAAYNSFLHTGTWPDKTVMVLEIRSSLSRGSINQGGHFEDELQGVEVHVKDGKWAFYEFGKAQAPAKIVPQTASCYSCHEKSGVVDTTFVQFYPTLLKLAKEKGTVKEGGER